MAHAHTKRMLLALAAAATVAGCSSVLPGNAGEDPAATGPMGDADGVVTDRVSVDADVPAVANLEPRLRKAIRAAARAAGRQGVELYLTSGWRSQRYQQSLYDDAVRRDGPAEARRLVAMPAASSEHVTGNAVDVGPTDAAYWLSRHGERFGLCRIYANEVWHYELESSGRCPDLLADASERVRS